MSSVATRETIKKIEIVVEIKKNHSALLAKDCEVTRKGQRNPIKVEGISSEIKEYLRNFIESYFAPVEHLPQLAMVEAT
jgi:hypothetical protein